MNAPNKGDVRSIADLDALPDGSIVRDRHGDAYQRCAGQWFACSEPWESDEVLEFAPLTVAHRAQP